MTNYAVSQAVKTELDEIHSGIQQAVEALATKKDYARAEELLRQMDVRVLELLNVAAVSG